MIMNNVAQPVVGPDYKPVPVREITDPLPYLPCDSCRRLGGMVDGDFRLVA